MFFFAKLLHAKPKHASGELSRKPQEMRAYKASSQSLIVITTSRFAIALDEIRTTRILREKAYCKQSRRLISSQPCYPLPPEQSGQPEQPVQWLPRISPISSGKKSRLRRELIKAKRTVKPTRVEWNTFLGAY